MCTERTNKRFKFNTTSPLTYLVAITLGILCGFSDNVVLQNVGVFISDVFIKIFKCISLPIIALSIIVTISRYQAESGMKRVWQRTISYTLSTTLVAASVSCVLYLIIRPDNVHQAVNNQVPIVSKISYLQHVLNIIPTNIFSPFIEHQVMGVLLVGILIGLAIRQIPDTASRQTITQFFQGAHGIFLVVTNWIVSVIPLGLFGFITATVIQLRGGMEIKGIGEYLAVVVLANLVQGFIILPVWLKFNGIKPFSTMKKMLPALSIAFFSKSSAGTLPVTMKTAEQRLHINPELSRFVLPLCTSLNMNGCAAFIFATVIYLMQNHGVDITPMTLGLWIIISTIAAVGNAGVPMGCFFLSASLLASMNIPIALLGIILPFYNLIDMIETALNVWSDSCVVAMVNEGSTVREVVESPLSANT